MGAAEPRTNTGSYPPHFCAAYNRMKTEKKRRIHLRHAASNSNFWLCSCRFVLAAAQGGRL